MWHGVDRHLLSAQHLKGSSLDVNVTDVKLVAVLDDLVRAGRLVRARVHLDARVQLELSH